MKHTQLCFLPCVTCLPPIAGIASSDNCTLCSSGKFCNMTGLALPVGDCFAGYLCIEGATHPVPNDGVNGPCPKGHYCELGMLQYLTTDCWVQYIPMMTLAYKSSVLESSASDCESGMLISTTCDCKSSMLISTTCDCKSCVLISTPFDCKSSMLISTTFDCKSSMLISTTFDCKSSMLISTMFDCKSSNFNHNDILFPPFTTPSSPHYRSCECDHLPARYRP